MANLAQPALVLLKIRCRQPLSRSFGFTVSGPVNRAQRIGIKPMKNVGEQQFLVLFFVVHSQFNAAQRLRRGFSLKQAFNSLVYGTSITQNLIQRGPRNELRSRFSGKIENVS